jgi:cystathionine beta-lyase/cystathionine gamma-synthase
MKSDYPETKAIHFGETFSEKGSINVPIYQNSTFKQKVPATWEQFGWEEFTYTRTNNPTEEALRQSLACLENGKYSVVFSSGLAAINALSELLQSGDHVISSADIYGGTHRLFTQFIKKRGINFSFVESSNIGEIKNAVTDKTKLIFVETPSNPLIKITDLKAVSSFAKEKDLLLAVDNTMATPYFQRPLDLGADLVINSTSKYISGHTNVVGGVVVANSKDLLDKLKFIHKATGGNPGPFDCYLTMLGIKTLAIRMRQHETNAIQIANLLSNHPKVKKVYFPGLATHPQHNLAKEQMSGFGAIVSFEVDGEETAAQIFLENLKLFALSVSFGSVTSLSAYPAKMSHKDIPKEERIKRGFSDSLIRLSAGIEKSEDLLEDITQALSKLK